MPETEWFEILGFEDHYVMTADGKRVHSLERRFRFGNSLRVTKPKEMTIDKSGRFQLRINSEQKRLFPEELVALIGKKADVSF